MATVVSRGTSGLSVSPDREAAHHLDRLVGEAGADHVLAERLGVGLRAADGGPGRHPGWWNGAGTSIRPRSVAIDAERGVGAVIEAVSAATAPPA